MFAMLPYIILGLFTGCLSGLIGLGGGVVIVPALVFLFGLSQQTAQGTTLALMVPPIGLLAAYQYYKNGHVDIRIALLIIVGFVIGSIFGAKFALHIPTGVLTKIFGISLLLISLKMILS